jgi:nitric oxide reductase large subunit
MPPRTPFRYVLLNAAVGFGVGALISIGAILFNVGGLQTLKFHTDASGVAAFLLVYGFGMLLGMLQAGIAIMALGESDTPLGRLAKALAVGMPKDD